MPTLIRLFIVLVILAILAFGGMLALTLFVKPSEKDVTIRIPARELVPPSTDTTNDPLGINALPAPVNIAPKDESSAPSAGLSVDISDDAASGSVIVTLDPGAPE